jgi:hypothetical protein
MITTPYQAEQRYFTDLATRYDSASEGVRTVIASLVHDAADNLDAIAVFVDSEGGDNTNRRAHSAFLRGIARSLTCESPSRLNLALEAS